MCCARPKPSPAPNSASPRSASRRGTRRGTARPPMPRSSASRVRPGSITWRGIAIFSASRCATAPGSTASSRLTGIFRLHLNHRRRDRAQDHHRHRVRRQRRHRDPRYARRSAAFALRPCRRRHRFRRAQGQGRRGDRRRRLGVRCRRGGARSRRRVGASLRPPADSSPRRRSTAAAAIPAPTTITTRCPTRCAGTRRSAIAAPARPRRGTRSSGC